MRAQDYYSAVVSASSALEYHGIMQRELRASASEGRELTLDQCMLLTNTEEAINDDDTLPDHPHYIYKHGIPLADTVTDAETIAPILVFNAALAHHLLARRSSDQRSIGYLQRAYRLYALAYDAPGIDGNPLFQFAVMNNAAVIERQIENNTESWDASMDYLMSLYMVLLDRGCTSFVRQMQGILVNAIPSSPGAHAA